MSDNNDKTGLPKSAETLLTHAGRHPEEVFGYVNVPVFRGSTIIFRTLDELDDYASPYRYGRHGNPTVHGVEKIVTELEGAAGTVLAPSGLAAVSTALLAVLKAGDELLVTETAYEPTQLFCTETLSRLGITTRFFDPRIGAGIGALLSERTAAVFVESPGSLTFEVQDIPAIAAAAHARNAAVIADSSWATPLFCRPLDLGADLVVHAGTKMFVGHSDAMFGTASANTQWWPKLSRSHRLSGVCASPDDSFLAARGLRTLAIRMREHERRALDLAKWFEQHPVVRQVLHPALEQHPDHGLWKRDFSGSGSVFSVLLEPAPRPAVAAMVNNFSLFAMGYSWGGFESLCLPVDPKTIRAKLPAGDLFRIHVGFEDVDDLKADMGAGLERYRAANSWFDVANGVAAMPPTG